MNLSNALLRQLNPRSRPPGQAVLTSSRLYFGYRFYSKKIGTWFKDQSLEVSKACTRQLEFIVAQRVRRSLQLFHLYSRIWDEVALKEFLRIWRRRMRRDLVMGCVGMGLFSWDQDRIDEEELYSYSEEIEEIQRLREATVVCEDCKMRLVIDREMAGVDYCRCKDKQSKTEGEWQPFVEGRDMLIWRREEPDTGGLFAYKVFGSFSDVTADDFLRVQVDVDYRREWDTTAKRLEIIDSDPETVSSENQRSDVIYWEMIWPRLFSNRDYVYQRRWVLDKEKGIVVIVSRGIQHPDAPDRPDTYRVNSYWSYMVIKPCNDFNKPGIEFGLTYFEDPGVNIPSAVRSWVAVSGLPDFLNKMRQAAKDYKSYIAKKLEKEVMASQEILEAEKCEEVKSEPKKTAEAQTQTDEEIITRPDTSKSPQETQNLNLINRVDQCSGVTSVSEQDDLHEQSEKETSYLRYFFLTRLFA